MDKQRVNCPICGRFVSKGLAEKYDNLKIEHDNLEKNNKQMAKELHKLRKNIAQYKVDNDDLQREIVYLRNRGFWARLLNR